MTADQARLALILLYGTVCAAWVYRMLAPPKPVRLFELGDDDGLRELRLEHQRLELKHRIAELREEAGE